MRSLEEIYDEVQRKCLEENCQSSRSIAITAMEEAIKEFRRDVSDYMDDKMF